MNQELRELRLEVENLGARVRAVQEALKSRPAAAQAEMAAEKQRLELVLEAARLAWWDQDFVSGSVQRSPLWASMLGYEPGEVPPTVEGWQSLLHPDDRPLVKEAARLHEEGATPRFSVEHRMRSKAGEWRWILNWGCIVARSPEGKPLRAVGTHLDITERKRKELEKELIIGRLQRVLARLRPLRGIIPICSGCHRARTLDEKWISLSALLQLHADVDFSHGLCPDCSQRLYPGLLDSRGPDQGK
ncbi:MAG: hypothetical protein Kow001_08650 [Acidobacteriota bacterium]